MPSESRVTQHIKLIALQRLGLLKKGFTIVVSFLVNSSLPSLVWFFFKIFKREIACMLILFYHSVTRLHSFVSVWFKYSNNKHTHTQTIVYPFQTILL